MPSSLLTRLLDLLYPPRCVICGCFLPSGDKQLCEKCRALPDQSRTIRIENAKFRECVAALPYREPYRTSLLHYKFYNCSFYVRVYGPILAAAVISRLSGQFDLITYVPLSRRRRRKRGYDQAKLLAEAVGREVGTEVVCTLEKTKHIPAQSIQPDAKARKKNIQGVYRAKNQGLFEGKRVLLIDDIMTTGSTLSEAAGELRRNGAKAVVCAALAATEHSFRTLT